MSHTYLTKRTYKEKLLDPRWQEKRLEVMKAANFICQQCGRKEGATLHVHHLCYSSNGNPWEVDNSALICLCERCHEVAHIDNLNSSEKEMLHALETAAMLYDGKNEVFNKTMQLFISVLLKYYGYGK